MLGSQIHMQQGVPMQGVQYQYATQPGVPMPGVQYQYAMQPGVPMQGVQYQYGMQPMQGLPYMMQPMGPAQSLYWLSGKEGMEVLTWGPVGALLTFLATLAATAFLSIRAWGGSPCGMPFCDISVYGAFPKHGASEVVFRAGFVILTLQMLPILWARYLQTWSKLSVIFFGLALVALLTMAFVPCYSSPVHFISAAVAFALLGIGQVLDAYYCPHMHAPWLMYVRYVMVAVTLSMFGFWFFSEVASGVSYALVEYSAAVMPFLTFLTWTFEMVTFTPAGFAQQQFLSVA